MPLSTTDQVLPRGWVALPPPGPYQGSAAETAVTRALVPPRISFTSTASASVLVTTVVPG